MPTTVFPKIGRHFTKKGKCPACGKMATRSTVIWKTVNPFNIDPDSGCPRTPEQVLHTVKHAGGLWQAEPVYHARCQP